MNAKLSIKYDGTKHEVLKVLTGDASEDKALAPGKRYRWRFVLADSTLVVTSKGTLGQLLTLFQLITRRQPNEFLPSKDTAEVWEAVFPPYTGPRGGEYPEGTIPVQCSLRDHNAEERIYLPSVSKMLSAKRREAGRAKRKVQDKGDRRKIKAVFRSVIKRDETPNFAGQDVARQCWYDKEEKNVLHLKKGPYNLTSDDVKRIAGVKK